MDPFTTTIFWLKNFSSKIFNLCLFILLGISVSGQILETSYLINIKPMLVKKYVLDTLKKDNVILNLDFNSSEILNKRMRFAYSGKTVKKIELVYSTYRLSNTFNQPELNRQRLESLKKISPELFESSIIEWVFIGQTSATTEEHAKILFHGFVIYFIPTPSKESSKSEIEYLSSVIHNDSLGKDSVHIQKKIKVKRKRHFSGFYYPISSKKRSEGILYSRSGIWRRKPKYTFQCDTIVRFDTSRIFVPSEFLDGFISTMPDSAIFKVLDRNKEWKNILFVCDVTGSMSPYSAELLIWNKLNFNSGRGKYYTFFNDGDNKEDRKKVIGRTGGIYSVEACSIEAVEEKAIYTIRKGDGGDGPENDIEALLVAIKQFSSPSEIVLIADNWAPIKDLELVELINKPIHIILCGVYKGLVNADYVELAYRSKGTIHTMEEDIEKLALMNEGETIKIGNNFFQLKKGKFVLIHKM